MIKDLSMSKKYRKDIDGLRAVAVLAVIFYHAGFTGFSGGYLGVDVFFVISGYLISSIIMTDLEVDNFSFSRFYSRRIRRIFPALLATILLCIPVSWVLLTPADFKDFAQSIAFSIGSISNILFWMEAGYFDTSITLKPLIHTWSLAIEEQFYLTFPLLLCVIWKFSGRQILSFIIVTLIASLIMAELTSIYNPSTSFYFIHTRAWELLAGFLIAYVGLTKPIDTKMNYLVPQLIGILAIGISIVLFNEETRHPGFLTAIPVIGTGLLLRYGAVSSGVSFIFCNPISVGLGLISYSLYLIHQPAFAFMKHYYLSPPTHFHHAVAIALCISSAYIFYKFIETPFRNKRIVKDKVFWVLIVSLSSFLIVFSIGGHLTKGYPDRFGPEFQLIFKAQRGIEQTIDGKSCHATFPSVRCIIGDSKAPIAEWALVGDSHAGSLGFAIDEMLKGIGSSALQLTQGGCAYALGLEKKSTNCLEVNNLVRSEIFASDIKNIVIAGRYVRNLELYGFDNGEGGVENSKEDNFFEPKNYENESDRRSIVLDSYFNSINELVSAGKNVFLIYPIPEVGWDVPRYIFKRKIRNKDGRVSTDASKYYERSSEVISMFDDIPEAENFYRIYPSNIFCDAELENRCLTDIGGRLLYFDDDHLTTFGAKIVTQKILDFQFDNKVD